MSSIGGVSVEISASLAPFEAGIARAEKESLAFASKVKTNFDQIGSVLTRMDAALQQIAANTVRGGQQATQYAGQLQQVATAANNVASAGARVAQGQGVAPLGRSAVAAANDLNNLRFQINDVFTSLASGGSLFAVLSQQAGQFSQVLGTSAAPARMLADAFVSMVSPVNLAIAAVAALAFGVSTLWDTFSSGSERVKDDLKTHADLIRQIKEAYGDAAEGVREYAAESQDTLRFLSERNVARLREDLRSQIGDVLGSFKFRTDDALEPFKQAFQDLLWSVRNGSPDVEKFRETIRRIGEESPDEELKDTAKAIIDQSDAAAKTSRAIDGMTDAWERLDASVRRAIENADKFHEATRGLRDIAPNAPLPDEDEARRLYQEALSRARTPGARAAADQDYIDAMERIRSSQMPLPEPRRIEEIEDTEAKRLEEQGKAYDRVVLSAERRLHQMEMERDAFFIGQEAAARLRYEYDLLAQATANGPIGPEQEKRLRNIAGQMASAEAQTRQLREAQQELKNAQREAEQAGKDMGSALEKAFNGIVQGGDAAKKAIIELALELAKSALFGQGAFRGLFQPGGFFGMGGLGGAPSPANDNDAVGGYAGLASGAVQRGILPAITPMGQGGIGGDARFPLGNQPVPTGTAFGGITPSAETLGMLNRTALQYGIPPSDFATLARIESAFRPGARNGRHAGMFQFSPGTGAQYGLSGASRYDPALSADAAARLWQDNSAALQPILGRPPMGWEAYVAHQQGIGGAGALFGNPSMNAASALNTLPYYSNRPGLANLAVTGNGGSLDMTSSQFLDVWKSKFEAMSPSLEAFNSVTKSATTDLGGFGKGLDAFGNALGSVGAGGAQGAGGGGGGIGGLFSSLLGGIFSLFGFADGGVTNRPAIFGEAGPEAAVPLPDGRRIPVELRAPVPERAPALGGRSNVTNINLGDRRVVVNGNSLDQKTINQLRREMQSGDEALLQAMSYQASNGWRND